MVGRGAMAEVYRGVLSGERGTQRAVAIKRLRDELRHDAAAVELFVNEARLAVRMTHPNVVHALELTRDEEGYALVLEWLDCASLTELRERFGPLPWRAVLYVGHAVCQALDYLHGLGGADAGVVHRDVTPSNIVVTASGQVKLGDFGVAWCAADPPLVGVQSAGTPGFAPPEQTGSATVDARADLFGLGVSLMSLAAELPAPLTEVLARASRDTPSERYQSARAFEAALQKVAQTLQTRCEPSAIRSWIDGHGGFPEPRAPRSIDGAVGSILGGRMTRRQTTPGGDCALPRERRRLAPGLLAPLVIGVVAGALGWATLRPPADEQPAAAVPPSATSREGAPQPTEAPSPPAPPPTAMAGKPAQPSMPGSRPASSTAGTVYLNAVPWATVTIDGARIGNTPIRSLKLGAGHHRVVLENPPQRLNCEVEIEVTSDASQVFVVDLRHSTVKKRLGP